MLDSDAIPLVQRIEMRRAFYAGAAAVFYGLIGSVVACDEDPTAEEMQTGEDLDQEFQEWSQALEAGEV